MNTPRVAPACSSPGARAAPCCVDARDALRGSSAPGTSGVSVSDTHTHHSVHGADKADEVVPAPKPSRAAENMAVESRVATIKPRPTSRCFPPVSDVNVSGADWGSGRGSRVTRKTAGPHRRRPSSWFRVTLLTLS